EYLSSGEIVFTGPAVLPDANERGWKDTFRANPGMVNRIITRFQHYSGLYLWHCHILEHEDHEMMRPFEVITGPGLAGAGEEEPVTYAAQPEALELYDSHPNPFNPLATIRFLLPEAQNVRLSVTDITGREVATLVNGWRGSGEHQVTFDAANLPSGIYFYRIKAGRFEDSGKMVLLQ
ncbi:MAG TPA: multicopper oxidase domain-containing protein, partial [bacterium]